MRELDPMQDDGVATCAVIEPEVALNCTQVVRPRPVSMLDVIEGEVVELLHGSLPHLLETLQLSLIEVFDEAKMQLMELEAFDEAVRDFDGRFDNLHKLLKLTVEVNELNHVSMLDSERDLQSEGFHDSQAREEAVERSVVVKLEAKLEVLEPNLCHLVDAMASAEKQEIREKSRFCFFFAILMKICDFFKEILLAGLVSLNCEAGVQKHVQAQSVIPNQPVFVAHKVHRRVKALQNDMSLLNPLHVHQQQE